MFVFIAVILLISLFKTRLHHSSTHTSFFQRSFSLGIQIVCVFGYWT